MAALLIVLVIAAILAERWSIVHALDGVTYDVEPDHTLVEIDQPFRVVSTVTNRSRRFIPFLRMVEQLPSGMKTDLYTFDATNGRGDHVNLNSTIFMMPRQKLDRSFEARLPMRGRYILSGATLYGGDFLGLRETAESILTTREVVALPAPCDVPELADALGGFMGDISVNRFILEDPILTVGFREYTGREPQKMIAWPQTLRAGKMLVKNYDYTTELTVCLILNVYDPEGRMMFRSRLEKAFSMARSMAELLEEKAVSYAFCTNASAAGSNRNFGDIPAGLGMTHLNTVLEGLGRATYDTTESFSQLLDRMMRRDAQAYIVIASAHSESDERLIERLKERTGSEVLALYAEDRMTETESESA